MHSIASACLIISGAMKFFFRPEKALAIEGGAVYLPTSLKTTERTRALIKRRKTCLHEKR